MSDEPRDEDPTVRAASPLRIGTAAEGAALTAERRRELLEMHGLTAPEEEASEVNTIIGVAMEPLREGDPVTLERRRELAASVYRTRTFEQTHGYPGSIAMPYLGSMYGSMAYMPGDFAQIRRGRQYQFTERFPKEVTDKAWKLLEQYMTPEQHFAFMEKADIELENVAGDFRLIINRSGRFTILEGARGKGIVAQSGNVRSYKYPLGDEVAAFIDWFNHRTKELIAQWGCGTYGIVGEGERR